METRSGELLSAFFSIVVALSLLFSPSNTTVLQILQQACALPEWAIMGLIGGVFCLIAVFLKSIKMQMLARFISGCTWGTLILMLAQGESFGPMFLNACVLFAFDIFLVLEKGHLWIRKNPSSTADT
jgi:hypothetical protein